MESPHSEFFVTRSIEELARIQSVTPLHAPSVLFGGIPEDGEIERFLEEIYRSRQEHGK